MTRRLALGRRSFLAINAAAFSALTACSALPRQAAVPPQDEFAVTVLGLRDIRYWGDEDSPVVIAEGKASYDRELAAYRASGHMGPLPPASYLAVSGGGEDGAFGAGLLVGWTRRDHVRIQACHRNKHRGTDGPVRLPRTPSTIRNSARYTRNLRQGYPGESGLACCADRGCAQFQRAAPADHRRLGYAIAARGYRGRIPARPVVADRHDKPRRGPSGHLEHRQACRQQTPGVLHLVQQILIASAAIPGAFPPEMIDVEVDGRHYQEMHVDGGASAQVFVYPPSLAIGRSAQKYGVVRSRHLYVIRNARLDPHWEEIKRQTLSIAGRAIGSLIHTQGVGDRTDLYRSHTRQN